MKNQLIILVLISTAFAAVTSSNRCTCEELVVQADCAEAECAWVTINGSSSCQGATTTVDCTTYTTESACDNTSTCAYKGTACAEFSGTCGDYSTTVQGGCQQKSYKCTEGTLANGVYPCVSSAVTCSAQTTAETCNYRQQEDGKTCYYSGTACAAYDLSKCSGRTLEELCNSGRCTWANGACSAQTCASITDTARCTSVYNDDATEVTVCAVSGTACADAADTSALTAATCFQNTKESFYWDGTACNACSGSSNSYLLAFLGAVVMLFI